LTLRIDLEVRDADSGVSTYYCNSLPTAGSTIPLTSLIAACWHDRGNAFDRATMQPACLAVQVVTSTSQAYPFNFCVTALSIQ
jgi:hypothetical protein